MRNTPDPEVILDAIANKSRLDAMMDLTDRTTGISVLIGYHATRAHRGQTLHLTIDIPAPEPIPADELQRMAADIMSRTGLTQEQAEQVVVRGREMFGWPAWPDQFCKLWDAHVNPDNWIPRKEAVRRVAEALNIPASDADRHLPSCYNADIQFTDAHGQTLNAADVDLWIKDHQRNEPDTKGWLKLWDAEVYFNGRLGAAPRDNAGYERLNVAAREAKVRSVRVAGYWYLQPDSLRQFADACAREGAAAA